jgi:hypothetical protein
MNQIPILSICIFAIVLGASSRGPTPYSLEFQPTLEPDPYERSRTTRYREFANGTMAFEESTPLLDKCVSAMQDLPGRAFYYPGVSDLDPTNQPPLFDDVLSCIRPKHLSITLPDPPAARLNSFADSNWMPYLQNLRADHVEVLNYSHGDGLPVASSSLTINFRHGTTSTR